MKKIIKVVLMILCVFIVIVGGYAGYVAIQYYRIADNFNLDIVQHSTINEISADDELTITTYNIGFGAYSPDFSFFMDNGTMKDGTKVTGTYGKALDKEHVEYDVDGAIKVIKDINPDFAFFQEVDKKGQRSYGINQYERIENSFAQYDNHFAENFHSAYLFYPFNDPHGKNTSGIVTLSQYQIQSAIRKSFTVSTGFDKFFDLDRCFSVSKIKVNNGKYLVLINLHMSAYDEGGKIRAKQMKELSDFLKEMENEGNYVIAGGDFNHDLLTYNPQYSYTKDNFPFMNQTEQVKPDWLAFFFSEDKTTTLPSSYRVIAADNTSTCRAAEMTWQPGINFVTVVDGFIVSSNIDVIENMNIQTNDEKKNITEYAYSDHQPAFLKFKLS